MKLLTSRVIVGRGFVGYCGRLSDMAQGIIFIWQYSGIGSTN